MNKIPNKYKVGGQSITVSTIDSLPNDILGDSNVGSFKQLFNGETHQFPMQELIQRYKNSDGIVKEELGNLIKYYQSTQLQINQNDFEYTILMDEPDRNLDIYNIKHLYDILSYHKECTQIIAIIHNPMLIYKLSKVKDVNIIELNKHYLKEIIKFIEK